MNLMRLQVPRGWAISDNKFYDVDPIVEEGSDFIENWYEGFVNDVMWIQENKVGERGRFIPEYNCWSIDFGWLPDSNINGRYVAKLKWMSTDELKTIERFESSNRFEIRDKIEFWMNDICEHYQEYQTRMLGS